MFGRKPIPEERRMAQIIWAGLAVVSIGAGVCMVVWPAWAVLKSRQDHDDRRPPNVLEIWFMRVVGIAIALLGGYGLYAILTGMPGPEGPPLGF
jgi:hypothetical protein